MNGVVVAFDVHAGWGTVRSDDGMEYDFHCTAIADGTRRIAERTPVAFEVAAGLGGRWEATAVHPTGV